MVGHSRRRAEVDNEQHRLLHNNDRPPQRRRTESSTMPARVGAGTMAAVSVGVVAAGTAALIGVAAAAAAAAGVGAAAVVATATTPAGSAEVDGGEVAEPMLVAAATAPTNADRRSACDSGNRQH